MHPDLVSAWKKRVSEGVRELFTSGSGSRLQEAFGSDGQSRVGGRNWLA